MEKINLKYFLISNKTLMKSKIKVRMKVILAQRFFFFVTRSFTEGGKKQNN